MKNEVSDRPVELWIKIVGLVALFTFPLIGTIGGWLIRGQDKTNIELSKLNGYLATHESRISRNEVDISSNSMEIGTNSARIYSLEKKLP